MAFHTAPSAEESNSTNASAADTSTAINESYGLNYKESYNFSILEEDDLDNDGLTNVQESEGGWDYYAGWGVWTTFDYDTNASDPDSDDDGVESVGSQLRASSAGRGLLDGYTVNISVDSNDPRNDTFGTSAISVVNDTFNDNGTIYTLWYGELNFSTCPVEVFVWLDTTGHSVLYKKAFQANEDECIAS